MNIRLAATALLLAGAASAHAVTSVATTATVTSTASVALQENLSSFLDLTQFDSSLGTLLSVQVELHAEQASTVSLENKSGAATTLNANINGTLSLGLPTGGTLTALPTASTSFSAARYDGTADYAGTSGTVIHGVAASADTALSFTLPTDLALFTGTSTLHLPITGLASVSISGTSNRRSRVVTLSGATATLTYTYELPVINHPTATVPEPGTWALMFAGLGMVGLLASRRRPG